MSANVTLGGASNPFAADSTQRTATLHLPGGTLYNIGLEVGTAVTVYVDVDGGTVTAADGGSIPIPVGGSLRLPHSCHGFTFKTASGDSYLKHESPA